MFSRADAAQLRESLGPIDFYGTAAELDAVQAYRDYYGLHFGSKQLPVRHSIGKFNSGDFQLVCQHFHIPVAQQRGTAFILHGYFDHCGIYGHLINHCLRAGFSVVIFDLPGHGLSSGKLASIASFSQYVDAMLDCLDLAQQQEVHQPWIIVGQSTGGSIIIDALMQHGLASRISARYLLLAPLIRPYKWGRNRLLFHVARWFLSASRRRFANNSHDPEFLNFLRFSDGLQSQELQRDWVLAMIDFQKRFAGFPVSDQPIHVIQGSGDKTVDWRYNLRRLREKFPHSKTYMVAEAGHHLINEGQPYRDRVFSILDQIIEQASAQL